MTRKGKIARLPSDVRHQLNSRLDDGEPGKDLVVWLNSLEQVRQILARDFGGRPVSEQNLSEWKQGGFLDWQQQMESSARLRELVEFSDNLASISPDRGIADRLSALLAVDLAAETRAVLRQITDPKERWQYVSQAIPRMNILRNGDQQAAQERRRAARWQVECDDRKWEEKKAALNETYEHSILPYNLRRQRETMLSMPGSCFYDIEHIEDMLAAQLKYKPYRYINPPDIPLWGAPEPEAAEARLDQTLLKPNQTKSNQIKPNQTKSNQIKPNQTKSN